MGTVEDISWFLLIFFTLSATVTLGDGQSVEQIANSLQVMFRVDENYSPVAERCRTTLSLRNIGSQPITRDNWSIYFCSIRMVEPDDLVENDQPKPEGVALGDSGFTVFHVAGCLFRIEPNGDFNDIAVGGEVDINYIQEFWIASRTDVMPYFYVANLNGETAPIPNTMDQMINFAAPFTLPRQYKRLEEDLYSAYTSQQRYDRYVAVDQGGGDLRIIPQPVQVELSSDLSVQIDLSWEVHDNTGTPDLYFGASYLAEKLGIIATKSSTAMKTIELIIDSTPSSVSPCENNTDRYRMVVEDNKITISAPRLSGVFYGVQTLLAAISEERRIGTGSIDDCPRFGYRGFMIDVGRHFVVMEEILRILDFMAMYKFNKFHFHLSDDEGWRVEILGLPELTTVGANQCHDLTGDECILPQLGSPPTKESSGSGFYTVEEYRTILQHAENLHIQVIPEIDTPGHAHSMIKAMEYRNRSTGDDTHVLHDPQDTSRYLSVQYFTDNSINPCINSSYTFMETVIDAFIEMHRDIQELEIFHWGGDEVPETAWLESPQCRALEEEDPDLPFNATSAEIKRYFTMRVQDVIYAKGLAAAAWEDGVSEKGAPFTPAAGETNYANAWSNVWEWENGGLAYRLANAGYQTIISHATHTYFDHPIEPDPEERGYYWATRFTDSFKTFSYVASDVYKNIDFSRMGEPLDREFICSLGLGCDELEKPENIIGIQGHVWSETMRTVDHLHGNVFPRLISLAERAWHKAAWEDTEDASTRLAEIQADWQGFANRVGYRELARLDALGIKYDIRPPAVLVDGETLRVKTEFPGLRVEVSTDWGVTWQQYFGGMPVTDSDAIFVTKSADGSRRSRPVKYNEPQDNGSTSSLKTSFFSFVLLIFSVIASLKRCF